jgi:hypothetical protein
MYKTISVIKLAQRNIPRRAICMAKGKVMKPAFDYEAYVSCVDELVKKSATEALTSTSPTGAGAQSTMAPALIVGATIASASRSGNPIADNDVSIALLRAASKTQYKNVRCSSNCCSHHK